MPDANTSTRPIPDWSRHGFRPETLAFIDTCPLDQQQDWVEMFERDGWTLKEQRLRIERFAVDTWVGAAIAASASDDKPKD